MAAILFTNDLSHSSQGCQGSNKIRILRLVLNRNASSVVDPEIRLERSERNLGYCGCSKNFSNIFKQEGTESIDLTL